MKFIHMYIKVYKNFTCSIVDIEERESEKWLL